MQDTIKVPTVRLAKPMARPIQLRGTDPKTKAQVRIGPAARQTVQVETNWCSAGLGRSDFKMHSVLDYAQVAAHETRWSVQPRG